MISILSQFTISIEIISQIKYWWRRWDEISITPTGWLILETIITLTHAPRPLEHKLYHMDMGGGASNHTTLMGSRICLLSCISINE